MNFETFSIFRSFCDFENYRKYFQTNQSLDVKMLTGIIELMIVHPILKPQTSLLFGEFFRITGFTTIFYQFDKVNFKIAL